MKLQKSDYGFNLGVILENTFKNKGKDFEKEKQLE